MSRRNMMIAAVFGPVLLGLAALVGLAGHSPRPGRTTMTNSAAPDVGLTIARTRRYP
jgi:hypothetical protein